MSTLSDRVRAQQARALWFFWPPARPRLKALRRRDLLTEQLGAISQELTDLLHTKADLREQGADTAAVTLDLKSLDVLELDLTAQLRTLRESIINTWPAEHTELGDLRALLAINVSDSRLHRMGLDFPFLKGVVNANPWD